MPRPAASPAAGERSAAIETACAALATAAVTTSASPSQSAPCPSHLWRSTTSFPSKKKAGGRTAKLRPRSLSKVTRATLACDRPTARRATAALATSGRKSASLCCGRAKSAPNNARKAPTAWRSSSAVTAPKDLPARYGKMPRPSPGPGCTCARGSETGGPCKTSCTLGPLRPAGRGVDEVSFLQDLLSCDKERKGEIQMNVCQNRVGLGWERTDMVGCPAVAVEEALRASFQVLLIYKPYLSLI